MHNKITLSKCAVLFAFLPPISAIADSVTEKPMSQRGAIQSMRVNGLTISYLSGKNADAHTPVFDMSVGEITIENTEKRPINLQYNSTNTFFNWHTFEFGTLVKNTYIPPRSHPIMSEPLDLINFNLLPGKKIQISRWDFMSLFQELGRAQFLDGRVCTRFEGTILVDGKTQSLRFGPHCFEVALNRDWEKEQKRYLQFFLDRDKQ